MRLYIDPGTGSMLFALLIGILGALRYLLRSWFVHLRFILSGGKKVDSNAEKLPIVIFSDDKRYWPVFKPVCEILNKKGLDVTYMTSSEDDPALNSGLEHIHGEFIGKGNKAFAKLNFLKANIVLSTTPGLDVYQWKRSKDVNCYIHMLHMPNELIQYRMFGLDYYDTILISGDYQEKDVRELEKIRNLPAKEIYHIGIPYMDEMVKRLKNNPSVSSEKKTVLLAPSWGDSAILSKYGNEIIDILLATDYHIIIRPHPQSFASETELMNSLMNKYPDSEQLEWNRDNDNFEVLKRSDIMISDFSGVIFDFALVYDKPIIYADTEYKKDPYDSWWLPYQGWTFNVLPRIGEKLTRDNFSNLKEIIDKCLSDEKYAKGRDEARKETWEYPGDGASRAADFIEKIYQEIISAKEAVNKQ